MKGKLLNSRRIDLRFTVLVGVDISEFRVTLLKKDLSDRPKAIPSSEMQYDRSRLDHLPFLEFQGSPVAYHRTTSPIPTLFYVISQGFLLGGGDGAQRSLPTLCHCQQPVFFSALHADYSKLLPHFYDPARVVFLDSLFYPIVHPIVA